MNRLVANKGGGEGRVKLCDELPEGQVSGSTTLAAAHQIPSLTGVRFFDGVEVRSWC